MATLNNTTINDTGFLTLPVDTNPSAGVQGSLRYNPRAGRLEYYHTRDVARWENLTNPFLTRSIITTGYLHGGYAASTVWSITNRVSYMTDTTITLGDGTQEAAHNYQSNAWNRTRNFTWGASGGHCVAANNTICFNMRTEQSQTSGYTRTFPVSQISAGTVQQEEYYAWWQHTGYSANIYEFNLTTETGYTAYATATIGSYLTGINAENYGVFWQAGAAQTWTYATRTGASRAGTQPSGDGYQHAIVAKQGYAYAGREGNPSTNWRKTNFFTNSSADGIGAKPYFSGEENTFSGQDWGYCIGFYQGVHVNTAFKFIYPTETQSGTTSSLEAKGKVGNSSATMSWRD